MENVAVSVRKKLVMDKYFSQVKIVTPNNISRLFDVSARSVVSSVELINNYLIVSGKIVANAVYLTDENKVENTETTLDFVEKQKANFMLSEIVGEDELEIQGLSVSSSEIMFSAQHKTELYGIYRYLVGDATKAENELVLSKKSFECLSYKASNDENFVVVEEVDSNLKDIKILNINSHAILNSVISSAGKVVLDGRVKVNAQYLDESGLGEIVKEFEFKQELAMTDALPGMNVEAKLKHLNTAITEQVKDDKTRLAFVIDLSAKAYLFENLEVQTFDDLFSLKNELVPVYDFAEFEEFDGVEFETDTVLSQSDISNLSNFDDMVGVFEPSVKILEFADMGEKVSVVAEIKALGVYRTETSLEKIDLVYETRFETEKEITKSLKNVKATAVVSAFKVKAGKDLENAFQVEYEFEFEKSKTEKFVKSYELVKEKENNDAGVKVYVSRGNQSIFDVAKALNVKPELISSQNEVGDYFEAGQKVFVYCPLNSLSQ